MLEQLNEGEKRLISDAAADDVSFGWMLTHLFLDDESVPSATTVDRAFDVVERLLGLGLIRLGATEPTGEMRLVGKKQRPVSNVRFVDEDPAVVRERTHRACQQALLLKQSDRWSWSDSAWLTATDRGRQVAIEINKELELVRVSVGELQPRSSGNVDGQLELVTPEGVFPSQGWCDFVLPLLPMIAGAVESAAHGTPRRVYFMSGSFSVRFESFADALRVRGEADRPGAQPRMLLESLQPAERWAIAVGRGCSDAAGELLRLGFSGDSAEVQALTTAETQMEQLLAELSR